MEKELISGYSEQVAGRILSEHGKEIAESLQSAIRGSDIVDVPGKLAAEAIKQSVKLSVEAVLFALADQHIIVIEGNYTPHITLIPSTDRQETPE